MRIFSLNVIAGLFVFAMFAQPAVAQKNADQIEKAMPAKPLVKPKKARKLLVYSKASGFKHGSIGDGKTMLQIMAKKTGAVEATFNDNAEEFTAEYLKKFDVFIQNNKSLIIINNEKPTPGKEQKIVT